MSKDMASITLKNIPEQLHATYKRRAKLHTRSLQAEILHTLGQSAGVVVAEEAESIENVAGSIRPGTGRHVSLKEMDASVDAKFRREWK